MAFERGPDGRFLPGVTTNPGGRPKRNQALAQFISEKTLSHAEILDGLAHDEGQPTKDRIQCIKLLWEYGHLKPERHVHVEGRIEHDASETYLQAMQLLAREAREGRAKALAIAKPNGEIIDVEPMDTTVADVAKLSYAEGRR